MRHRLQWFIYLRAQGLRKADERLMGCGTLPYLTAPVGFVAAWATFRGPVGSTYSIGFSLVFCSNHSLNCALFELGVGQTDGRTEGRIAVLFNACYGRRHNRQQVEQFNSRHMDTTLSTPTRCTIHNELLLTSNTVVH